MIPAIPPGHADLVSRAIYASLGTVRPDGAAQVNPMCFEFDGETFRFSHTRGRAKYRNLQHNPSMTLLIVDPDDPQRYLEVRGHLEVALPDPHGLFHTHLAARYGEIHEGLPADAAERVVLVMRPDRFLAR